MVTAPAGVPQNATDGIVLRASFLVLSHMGFVEDANGRDIIAVEGEFGRVMEHQNQHTAGGKALPCGLKMPKPESLPRRPDHWRENDRPLRCSPNPDKLTEGSRRLAPRLT